MLDGGFLMALFCPVFVVIFIIPFFIEPIN